MRDYRKFTANEGDHESVAEPYGTYEIRNILSPQVIVSMPEEFALKKNKQKKQLNKDKRSPYLYDPSV